MSITHGRSQHHVDVYEVNIFRTTMRSSHGSWFIGTLFKDERFFHIPTNDSYQHGYIWGYSYNQYGAYGGYGWVKVKGVLKQDHHPTAFHLDESVIDKLLRPISRRGPSFYHEYARPPYPPKSSNQARGKVHIRKGTQIPFYSNYKYAAGKRDGRLHPQHPFLTETDDVRFRYVVKTNHNLIVVDYYRHGFHGHATPEKGDGVWGVILKSGDNFTYDKS